MIVLETKNMFEKFIDLRSLKITERQRQYLKWILPICATIFLFAFWLSIVFGLLWREDEAVSKLPLSVCAIMAYPMVPLIHWHLLINYERFCELFNDMATISIDCK